MNRLQRGVLLGFTNSVAAAPDKVSNATAKHTILGITRASGKLQSPSLIHTGLLSKRDELSCSCECPGFEVQNYI